MASGDEDYVPNAWQPVASPNWWLQTPRPDLASLRARAQAAPERLFELAEQLEVGALHTHASNTQRAYASDWGTFVHFCKQCGLSCLPASPIAVEAFIEASAVYSPELTYKYFTAPEVPRRGLKSSSLRRAIAAIGAVHTWLGLPNPTFHPDVKRAIKVHTHGRSNQTPKAPFTCNAIERALASYRNTPKERRSAALLAVAFSTLLRRSELVALQVEDFERSEGADGGGVMRVRMSKPASAGEQLLRYVTPAACHHLERWLAITRFACGPLFPRLNRDQQPLDRPLHANQVAVIFKDAARRAGLEEHEVAQIAGHSTRIGAAHELARAGASLAQLMRAGGWHTPHIPVTYLREADREGAPMDPWARSNAAMPPSAPSASRAGTVPPSPPRQSDTDD